MPKLETEADIKTLRAQLRTQSHTRIPQYRQIIDRRMDTLEAVKSVLSPDYQKAWVPYQSGAPAKSLYRLTHIMASNASEIRYKARSTDPSRIKAVQEHEDGHEALDPLLFPIVVRRKMYAFLGDSYTVVAVDVQPNESKLADYADREGLQGGVDDEYDEGDTAPKAKYARAYAGTDAAKSTTERHEAAYDAVTEEAYLAEGVGVRVRVVDPLTFWGFQTDEEPCLFAVGMETGRKQLNPLLKALKDFGVVEIDGCLYIEKDGEHVTTQSYKALGVGMIADSQSAPERSQEYEYGTGENEYVEYTQVRTTEETVIYIENPSGKQNDTNGEHGILIRVPNLFGQRFTGYFLIEGDAKLRSGDIEERYDPPLLNLINEAQQYNITRSIYQAMSMAEGTRSVYQYIENQASGAVEPHDSTQETKSATPTEGEPIPQASGKVLRVEGFGQKMEALLQHALEELQRSEPTEIWGGTGSSSETGIAIARRETALLTELTPYQANVATVCKLIHMAVDQYVVASGEPIKLAYLPQDAGKETKPELREITPESAQLPMDMDYTIGSDTPESKQGRELLSRQRYVDQIIGKMDYMEDIGIKDPVATEQRWMEDALVNGAMPVVSQTFQEVIATYTKAAAQAALGPLPPAPPAPPQLVGPNGMPISSGMAPGGGGPPPMLPPAPAPSAPMVTPQAFGPPPQTVPTGAMGVPVAAGGPEATV